MTLADHLRRQFIYDDWANREVLAAIQVSGTDQRSLRYMAHILAAERLWLERLLQTPQSTPVWPEPDLEWCLAEAAGMGQLWQQYLDSDAVTDLSRSVSYKNSKGEAWSSTIEDILTHVIVHSAYHRGQIASHMREIGHTPAYTDFIHGVRLGLVK